MHLRTATAPTAAFAALALAACSSDKPAADPGADSATAAASSAPASSNVVTVVASDYKFESPSEAPAGFVTFKLVNQGPSPHHVQLVRLDEGKTVDDFLAALKAGGPPPRWATMAGGPNPPGLRDTASTTVELEPGNYAVVCFIPAPDGVPHIMKGMVRPLTVTASAGGAASAAAPTAQVTMKLLDYDFELSQPLRAGKTTLRIDNAGPQPHEVTFVRLERGKAPIEFAEWGEKQVGPAPGVLAGGVSAIMPGTSAYVDLDLDPGEYGLICFIPDMKDGKPHFHHGMLKKITVSA